MDREYVLEPPPREARMWAMWCHLSALSGFVIPIPFAHIVVPLIIWNLKKGDDPFIDEQGRESLNFQISLLIYGVICGILMLVAIGFLLIFVVVGWGIVNVIIASIKANDGVRYRYPLTIRLL